MADLQSAPTTTETLSPTELPSEQPASLLPVCSRQSIDGDLVVVMHAWPNLPPHIRAAVLALVQTARG